MKAKHPAGSLGRRAELWALAMTQFSSPQGASLTEARKLSLSLIRHKSTRSATALMLLQNWSQNNLVEQFA